MTTNASFWMYNVSIEQLESIAVSVCRESDLNSQFSASSFPIIVASEALQLIVFVFPVTIRLLKMDSVSFVNPANSAASASVEFERFEFPVARRFFPLRFLPLRVPLIVASTKVVLLILVSFPSVFIEPKIVAVSRITFPVVSISPIVQLSLHSVLPVVVSFVFIVVR